VKKAESLRLAACIVLRGSLSVQKERKKQLFDHGHVRRLTDKLPGTLSSGLLLIHPRAGSTLEQVKKAESLRLAACIVLRGSLSYFLVLMKSHQQGNSARTKEMRKRRTSVLVEPMRSLARSCSRVQELAARLNK
jgi:hypothetical protein